MTAKTGKGFLSGWLFFIACITVLSSCAYTVRSSDKLLKSAKKKKYDLVIVPGLPFQPENWNTLMKGRVYWSKYLFDNGIAKNIMYSGSAVGSPYYEGIIMALYAEAIGIPKKNIFTEIKAEHSTENVYYSYKLAKKMGFKKIAVASDPFQTKRLVGFTYRRVNTKVGMIPMMLDSLRTMYPEMTNPVIDYKKAFNPDFVSIKKRLTFWQRLRGTFGHTLNKKVYD